MTATDYMNSPVPHFAIDAECKINMWNPACAALTGYSAEDVLGTDMHRVIFNDSDGVVLVDEVVKHKGSIHLRGALAEKIRTGFLPGTWVMEISNFKNGFLTCVSAPVYGADGTIAGAIQTIWKAEQEKASYDNYVTLVENFPMPFLITQHSKYVLVNKFFARLLGYKSSRELEGVYSYETIAPSHRKAFTKHIEDMLAGKKAMQKAWWPHKTRTGDIIWLEGHPRSIIWRGEPAVLSTLTDVTERYRQDLSAGFFEAELLEDSDIPLVVKDRYRLGNIVGKSPAIREVYAKVLKAAPTNSSVMITGESGTGKEVVARAIHQFSRRSKMRFVPVNCGAIPADLMESEFFGYKKGAFTGAYKDKTGFLHMASGGTLFLDEVAELSVPMQVKLLRFLDDQIYTPLGSTDLLEADIRIIAATNKDLRECINNGSLREDFFFRLNVVPIALPPLRERKEDITLLIEEFTARHGNGKKTPFVPGYIIDTLLNYDWPGNIRELQNVIERFMTIGTLDIKERPGAAPEEAPQAVLFEGDLRKLKAHYEERLIEHALRISKGNKAAAAKILGLPLRTFYRKLESFAKNGT